MSTENVTGAEAYYKNRCEQQQEFRERGIEPYPHAFDRTLGLPQFRERFGGLKDGETSPQTHRVAGRITGQREHGNLVFMTIEHEEVALQVMMETTDENNKFVLARVRRGDIIGVTGVPSRTKRGELSIRGEHVQVLSWCLRELPPRNQLDDEERRARERHVDLLANDRSRQVLIARSKIIRGIRDFFHARGYMEVETPTLSLQAGGAAARPFVTHHNALDTAMFMRVAPELFLKQMAVGGLDRVFEIGKNFRNEGCDRTHNPEFTAIEAYTAFCDYNDLMTMTEDLLRSLVRLVNGGDLAIYRNVDGVEHRIDFAQPFRRVYIWDELEAALGVELPDPSTLETEDARLRLVGIMKNAGIKCGEPLTVPRVIDAMVGELLEPDCVQPTFLLEHPQIMSPLAKYHRGRPGLTERFELFVGKKEWANAFTELNDPEFQRRCFREQAADRDAGDGEAMPNDEEYCKALDHGLPPMGGWGLGIDRVVMALTGVDTIRDVIAFPTMKPLEAQKAALAAFMAQDKAAKTE